MKTKLLVLSAALMLVLAGCNTSNKGDFTPDTSAGTSTTETSSSEGGDVVHVESVSLNQESVTLTEGETVQLVATVLPQNATNKNISWSATGNGIVSVDDGLVEALSEGTSTVTVTTADGSKTAQCTVTVNAKSQKPADAVDLEYSTDDDLSKHGDNYVYFNNPEWWEGGHADVNEAYIYEGKIVFDYTFNSESAETSPDWVLHLMRKNSSLTQQENYDLTFKFKSNKAGRIVVNGVNKTVVVGDNNISVTYTETAGASFNIQFPFKDFGTARVTISEIKWEAKQASTEPTEGELAYSLAADLASHGNDYVYFNNPEWWDGGHADVNEATYYDGVLTFDYTYDSKSSPTCPAWTVQLMRRNTSLTTNNEYVLSFKMNSSVAGKVWVNDKETAIAKGDNDISVTYKETGGISFGIQFPFADFGSAKVVITDIAWAAKGQGGGGEGGGEGGETDVKAPVGVVVNPVAEGYIVAFAAVDGATGYKAYYVNADTSADVDSEPIANPGALLTKIPSLADGNYKVYVTTLKGDKESARSESFGTFQKGGEIEPVAPAGVVVNPVAEGYIVAFAPAAGATGYKVYYVNASTSADVDSEVVANAGALLTKPATLPAGTYKVYVSTLVGDKESARSESFGNLVIE